MLKTPAQVLDAIIRNAGGKNAFQVWSYRDDFEAIWDALKACPKDLPPNLIIVWDGVPESEDGTLAINVADYVTVFDWVVALCCKAATESTEALPQLRLYILDLTPPQHSTSFAIRTFARFLPDLPWVRVYRPVARAEQPFNKLSEYCDAYRSEDPHLENAIRPLLGPAVLGLDALLGDLKLPDYKKPVAERKDDAAKYHLIEMPTLHDHAQLVETAHSLRSMWINELTKPEKRHSVSNLVAPFVLSTGLSQLKWSGSPGLAKDLEAKPQRGALTVLLESLTLLDSEKDAKPGERPDDLPLVRNQAYFPTDDNDPFRRFEGVQLLLVDDLFALGYERVVQCLLFGAKQDHERGIRLTAQASPNSLVSALYRTAALDEPRIEKTGLEEAFLRKLLYFYDQTTGSEACQTLASAFPALCKAVRAAREIVDPDYNAAHDQDCPQGAGRCPTCGAMNLNHGMKEIDWELPHVFGYADNQPIEKQGDKTPPDILLLDLRLFSGFAASEDDRPDVYHHLLLPLLISHIDPSLPIILFSSTQQRVVAEACSDHPSIITTFGKPLVSGYLQQRTPINCIDDLKRAVRRATELHEMRVVWHSLRECKWGRRPVFSVRRGGEAWRDYNNGGESSDPLLSGSDLRKRLKREYCRYFLTNRFFEYLSLPRELLEGALVPSSYPNSPDQFSFELRKELNSDNNAVAVLSDIRNAKVHGQAVRTSADDSWNRDVRHRRITCLMAMLLAGYINSSGAAPKKSFDPRKPRILVYKVRNELPPEIQQRPEVYPDMIMNSTAVNWDTLALYSFVWRCLPENGQLAEAVTDNVAIAIERLSHCLLSEYDTIS